jgi:two-component system phosphate regulon response regulator PhoB
MAQKRIVLIEDEPDIQELLAYNLEREGYAVSMVGDGEQGLQLVREVRPDLVLLDIMLPGIDGIEVCRMLRQDDQSAHMPIIMLTAKSEESDVVLGLGIGADDYVSKPFSPKELLARIKAQLRRQQIRQDTSGSRIEHGPLLIDIDRHEVRLDGEKIELTATEFRMLHFFAGHPGRVFSRDQLLDQVVGDRAIVIDRNIDVHVRSIRKKLGPYRGCIETIRGVGYRFSDQG